MVECENDSDASALLDLRDDVQLSCKIMDGTIVCATALHEEIVRHDQEAGEPSIRRAYSNALAAVLADLRRQVGNLQKRADPPSN